MTTEKNNADNEVEESTEEVVEEAVVEAEEAPAEEGGAEEPEVARTPRSTTSAPQNRAELTGHATDRHAHNAQNR